MNCPYTCTCVVQLIDACRAFDCYIHCTLADEQLHIYVHIDTQISKLYQIIANLCSTAVLLHLTFKLIFHNTILTIGETISQCLCLVRFTQKPHEKAYELYNTIMWYNTGGIVTYWWYCYGESSHGRKIQWLFVTSVILFDISSPGGATCLPFCIYNQIIRLINFVFLGQNYTLRGVPCVHVNMQFFFFFFLAIGNLYDLYGGR